MHASLSLKTSYFVMFSLCLSSDENILILRCSLNNLTDNYNLNHYLCNTFFRTVLNFHFL